jgi:magnesium transporter
LHYIILIVLFGVGCFFFAARERAMVVNLEFIKAVVTAEELYLLDATNPMVVPFVQQLKDQFPLLSTLHRPQEEQQEAQIALLDQHVKVSVSEAPALDAMVEWSPQGDFAEGPRSELPFEFKVLELALDVVCNYLERKVTELQRKAYPTLDEFTRNITSKNLELVRSLKTSLTRLTSRVQKVILQAMFFDSLVWTSSHYGAGV